VSSYRMSDHETKRPGTAAGTDPGGAADSSGKAPYPARLDLQQDFLDQLNDAVVVLTPRFCFEYCNLPAQRLFGWTLQEAMGQQYRTVAGTEVSDAERAAIHREILGKGSWNGEIICTDRSGRRFLTHVSWSVLHDQAGDVHRVVGIHRDIAAPKQMEQALRESQNRLELVHSALALGTWELDVDSEIVHCSEQQLRLYGIFEPRGPFTLQEWVKIVHPEDLRPLEEIRFNFGTGDSFEQRVRVIWPDGSVHWLHSKARLISQPGEPRRVIGADYDVTDQEHADQRLRAQTAELQNSYRVVRLEKNLLELVARGVPLTDLLNEVTRSIEAMSPDCLCSVMLLDAEEGRFLSAAAAPSLPPGYVAALSNLEIGPEVGACGSAAFRNETIVVEDIAVDPRFAGVRDFVTGFGLRACWSVPVRSFDDRVIGTFAMYQRKPTRPAPSDLHLIEAAARLAGNVIEWRRSEGKLRETSQRLEMAERAAGFGIWEVNIPTGQVLFSEGFAGLLGLPADRRQSAFSELESMLHPEDRGLVVRQAEAAVQTGAFQAEFRVILPDGSVRWHRSQGRLEMEGGVAVRATGAIIDITREKKTEHTNAQLAAIVENTEAAIISVDADGKVLTWNGGAEKLYGYSAGEMTGKAVLSIVPPEKIGEHTSFIEQIREGDSIRHVETVRLRKSGDRITVTLTMSPMWDSQGRFIGIAKVSEDITHIKELERQLAHTQKLESIGQLAAGIAHEINTPIQYIGDNGRFLEGAFCDLIALEDSRERAGPAGPVLSTLPNIDYLRGEVPKAIEQLLSGVNHVAGIVRAMKDFSHPGPIEKMPLDINQVIQTTALVSKNEWKYVAELTMDLDPDLPAVPCLGGEINQVFLNLIVNAAHAIGEVVKDSGQLGRIHITTRSTGELVEIRVIDTGCGIPQPIRGRVFDPFFTTKPVGKGTGQGLAIAHGVVVHKHGGSIRFESETGQGTTFIVRLPLDVEKAQAA